MDRRTPKAGETWWWSDHKIQITRVSIKHGWADIYVTAPNGLMWSKRQPLPFPSDFCGSQRHASDNPTYSTRAAEEDTNGC